MFRRFRDSVEKNTLTTATVCGTQRELVGSYGASSRNHPLSVFSRSLLNPPMYPHRVNCPAVRDIRYRRTRPLTTFMTDKSGLAALWFYDQWSLFLGVSWKCMRAIYPPPISEEEHLIVEHLFFVYETFQRIEHIKFYGNKIYSKKIRG